MAKRKLNPLAGDEGGEESRRLAAFWKRQFDDIDDSPNYKNWYKRGAQIEQRYRDDRNRADEEGYRRYNALWANVQILKPALYGKCPVPIAERRFKDKDPIGRGAATVLERALRNEIEICGYHEALARAVEDYLLPGRGVVWVRYEPIVDDGASLDPTPETDMEDTEGDIKTGKSDKEESEEALAEEEGGETLALDEEPTEDDYEESDEEATEEDVLEGTPMEGKSEEGEESSDEDEELHDQQLQNADSRVLRESTPVDYIPWPDFYALPARARTWTEVTAIAKKVYMSRDQAKRRFGDVIGDKIPFQRDQRSSNPNR